MSARFLTIFNAHKNRSMKGNLPTLRVNLLLVFILISVFQLKAQVREHCGTMKHHQIKMLNDPDYARSYLQNKAIIQQWIDSHANLRSSNSAVPDTIPVVVHIVWKTNVQNISDAQIISQIDALNEDFNRMNADSVNTPVVWQPIAGKIPYYFVLARRDPDGNPSTGITRTQTTDNAFDVDDQVKFDTQGGVNSWDVDTYFNIWVCNLVSGLFGYGEFPAGVHTSTYGYVCDHEYFGRTGTAIAPFDLGRTTTHELGHCFDLYHIWGDDGGGCTGSDNISDTPNQGGPTNFTCYTYPHTDACSPSAPGIMFMNFMDYSVDSCMNLFTQNQATRMVAAINNFYPTIVNSTGKEAVILQAVDAGIPHVISPSQSICSNTVPQIVTIKNWGTSDLTSATIYYRIDNDPWQSYAWSGTLTSLATTDVTLPNANSTNGTHTFSAYTAMPNGSGDMNSVNDTSTISFSILSAGLAIPFNETFTAAGFPPTDWNRINPDAATTWARGTSSHSGGNGSMWMDNYNYNANGQIDEMETPFFDLSVGTNPELTFYLAYRLYTNPTNNPNYSDTLEVLISTDCGSTYTSLYKKFGTTLATTSPAWASNEFFPTSTQWRMETIDLSAYASQSVVRFKFRNINDYQNHLYVDDINVTSSTSINENDLGKLFNVYPNPTNGNLTIQFNSVSRNTEINILDLPGKVVYQKQISNLNSTLEQIDLSGLSNGIYILQVKSDRGVSSERIVLEN